MDFDNFLVLVIVGFRLLLMKLLSNRRQSQIILLRVLLMTDKHIKPIVEKHCFKNGARFLEIKSRNTGV